MFYSIIGSVDSFYFTLESKEVLEQFPSTLTLNDLKNKILYLVTLKS
jgi:hypothetical protein